MRKRCIQTWRLDKQKNSENGATLQLATQHEKDGVDFHISLPDKRRTITRSEIERHLPRKQVTMSLRQRAKNPKIIRF